MKRPVATMILFLACTVSGEVLETPSFKIDIDVQCPEGYVTCKDVHYVGTNKRTGKTISLIGETVHTYGPDRSTPSRFLGYFFQNGRVNYFIGENGLVRVRRGQKVIVEEMGQWQNTP
jgi:hypothetical protein